MTPRTRLFALMLTAAPLLAACSHQNKPTAMQASQQTFTNVSSIDATANTKILSGPQFMTVGAYANKTTPIINVASLKKDCTLESLNNVMFTTRPSHGNAVIAQHQGYSTYAATSALFPCNKVESTGNFIDYTPNANYTGPDFIGAEVTLPNGQVIDWTITINVTVDKTKHSLLD